MKDAIAGCAPLAVFLNKLIPFLLEDEIEAFPKACLLVRPRCLFHNNRVRPGSPVISQLEENFLKDGSLRVNGKIIRFPSNALRVLKHCGLGDIDIGSRNGNYNATAMPSIAY